MENYLPTVRRDLGIGPRGNSRRADNHQSDSGVGVSTPRGAVSTRVISVFVAGLLGFKTWLIPDPGTRNYPPRVRRDLNVVPRGNARRAVAP